MSFVSVIATRRYITFMSDGRVTNYENNTIQDEQYNKVKKATESIIFSVTGDFHTSKVLFEKFHLYNCINAKTFIEDMFNSVGKGKTNKDFQVLVGGLDEKNEVFFSGFNSQETEGLQFIYPTEQTIRHGSSGNFDGAQTLIGELISEHCAEYNRFTLLDAQMIQERVNKRVSELDSTVNDRVFKNSILLSNA
ncbi:hypothetical protein [Sporosarcina sp. SAFN-010]|uniref:hypothetical protein n=1 Tax=Sporosarcina sp. SAFN-010 TaxID=3387273 RepID=UPI003F7EB841